MRSLKLWHLISAYQYALHTTSFEEQPISDRTSAGLEQEETEHDVDLIHECVVKMAKEISDFMDITPDKQRNGQFNGCCKYQKTSHCLNCFILVLLIFAK